MTNEELIARGFEAKTVDGQDYIRISTMAPPFRGALSCSPRLDRSHIRVLYACCSTFDEYIRKEHFLDIISLTGNHLEEEEKAASNVIFA